MDDSVHIIVIKFRGARLAELIGVGLVSKSNEKTIRQLRNLRRSVTLTAFTLDWS